MSDPLRVIVVGLGIQGYKRKKFAEDDFVCSVDPVNEEADFQDIQDVPLDSYDAILACIPDTPKMDMLNYAINHGKHILVEKPLWAATSAELKELEIKARKANILIYTAYNHRFEPHFAQMHDLIKSKELGEIYSCRLFYGNGTAKQVKDSVWRDQGAGVLPDLGSHLLDTIQYWFNDLDLDFQLTSARKFENEAPDHVIITSNNHVIHIELEMTLLMWRNHFTCDILAEKGSAHITSLCKWGPSSFIHRERILPSGRPPETVNTLTQDDPTWALEYQHFKRLIAGKTKTNLGNDIWIHDNLEKLSHEAVSRIHS